MKHGDRHGNFVRIRLINTLLSIKSKMLFVTEELHKLCSFNIHCTFSWQYKNM
jgi:hypothetical protein